MPSSKLDKKIKNAELHLKRAEQRGLDPFTVSERQSELDALLVEKEKNRAQHRG